MAEKITVTIARLIRQRFPSAGKVTSSAWGSFMSVQLHDPDIKFKLVEKIAEDLWQNIFPSFGYKPDRHKISIGSAMENGPVCITVSANDLKECDVVPLTKLVIG